MEDQAKQQFENSEGSSNSEQYLKQIEEILGARCTDKSMIGLQLIRTIESIPKNENKIKALEFLLTKYSEVPDTGLELKGEIIGNDEWEMLNENHLEYVVAVFNRLTFKRPSSLELAKGVKKLIEEFETESDKAYVLATILSRDLIPYIQIPQGGQYVTDSRFKVLVDELKDKIKLLRAIQNSKLKNKTQMASLMLGVVNSASNDEEKSVIMTFALALEYNRGKKEGSE